MKTLKDLSAPQSELSHSVVGYTTYKGQPAVKLKSSHGNFWDKPRALSTFIEEYTMGVITFKGKEPEGNDNAALLADMVGKPFIFDASKYTKKPKSDGDYGTDDLDADGVAGLLD